MNQCKENTDIFSASIVRALVLALAMCFPLSSNAIQILEHTNKATGKSSITVGITQPQLDLGPINGFFINLVLFPFIGPLPEIRLFEFALAGASTVDPNGQYAQFDFNDEIINPTDITAELLIDFDPSISAGSIASYELSSLDSSGQILETLTLESRVIPEPPTYLLLLIPIILLQIKTYFAKSICTVICR